MRFRKGCRKGCTALSAVASLSIVASPAAMAATATANTGAVGAAWRTVAFDGVSLKVPASWPVINLARHPLACPRLDVHAVYLGTPGPDPACPASLQGKTTTVTMRRVDSGGPDLRQATRATVVGGRAAATNTDAAVTHTIVDILPPAGVEVSLSYGSSGELARSIQRTIRISRRARPSHLAAPAVITPAAAQGVVQGRGFDTCAAPSAATMKSWLASPYRAIGIYIGGVNRGCAQANLTPDWIKTIQGQGWHYFPFYVGLQAPCVAAVGDATISAAGAAVQGKAAADDAVTQAADLGIPAGTPMIYDMEGYRGGCGSAVTTFLSAWDRELHARGYVAGVYESFSNVGDLISASGQITEPDVLHYADWDGRATTSSPYLPARWWTNHERIHQYQGGHNEIYNGASVNIDNDELDVTLSGTPTVVRRRPRFRVTAAINSNGSAEWFAKAVNHTLRHNYQHPVGSADWSATRAVGNSPAGLVSNPAVTADADGSLTLFARTSAGQVVNAWQQAGAPNDWLWNGAVGGGKPPGTATASPGAIQAPGGDVAVFTATASGTVVTTQQDSPSDNTGWSAWTSIGGDCASSPVPFVDAAKTLEVFCRTGSGALAVDVFGPSAWRGWHPVDGGPSGLTGTPAAVSGSGGQTEVFTAASGGLAYAGQSSVTGSWTWGGSPAGDVQIKNSPTAVAWPGGGVGVLAQQANGELGYAVQQGGAAADGGAADSGAADGGAAGWGDWTPLGAHMFGSPTAWANAGGDPEVAILNKRLKIAVSTFSAGAWSRWTRLGGGY
jgi:hypothetical protein